MGAQAASSQAQEVGGKEYVHGTILVLTCTGNV